MKRTKKFLSTLSPLAAAIFLIFNSGIMSETAHAVELSLDFIDFPKKTADLFRAGFPEIKKELENINDFRDSTGSLFIYRDSERDEYKATFILGLDLSVFGVDERRISKEKLDLRPFAPLFLALDDYIESVRVSSSDMEERRLISKIVMSIMLINEKGDSFEFYADTDYFMGLREVIISPNFVFEKREEGEKKGKKVFAIYMEPTEIVSQIFILPPARDENGTLNPVSLLYEFLYFEY
ncbi:MAG: hypothetical protein JW984_00855 [Deltaproteobacteria bacterium]|uniref:Uncharacterized protein n=1 Tax=Candidatus Zymogenus saltonus TaxID=2844893 RepID=A0A9D8PM38_9DELT|nr:hypothetical protein [Candidatus Zymogenus saltonus]